MIAPTLEDLMAFNVKYKTAKSTALMDAKRIAAERIAKARKDRDLVAALLADQGFTVNQIREALGTTNRGTAKEAIEAGRKTLEEMTEEA